MENNHFRLLVLGGRINKKVIGERIIFKTGIREYESIRKNKIKREPLWGRGWHICFSNDKKRELLIIADSYFKAQDARKLYICAETLENQRLCQIGQDEQGPAGWEPKYFPMALEHEESEFKYEAKNAYWAARIAARASQRKKWKYALARYWVSHKICSTDYLLTHRDSIIYGEYYKHEVHRTTFAQAIVAAYGVIEELNLEIKLPRGNRYKSIYENDEWDEKVYNDISKRLKKVGAIPDHSFYWIIRNNRKRIEKDFPFKDRVGIRTDYKNNKDCFVSLIDALLRASRLRSKVSAHEFNELTAKLSPLDVLNVQNLARKMLLLSLGFGNEERYIARHLFP